MSQSLKNFARVRAASKPFMSPYRLETASVALGWKALPGRLVDIEVLGASTFPNVMVNRSFLCSIVTPAFRINSKSLAFNSWKFFSVKGN